MSPLDRKVLEEIEKRGLKPKPAAYFLARRSVFWLLAVLSVLLGGISVAVALFAVQDFEATGGRRFTDMPFDDVFTSLPVVWTVVVALLIASAVFSLRRTRRGYRWRIASVLAMVAGASALLGLAFHAADAGRLTHEFFAARLPGYAAYTYVPYAEWSRPDEGSLGGEVLSVDGNASLRLKAFDGKEWSVDISAARINADEPLDDEGDIAITGTRTGPTSFKAETIAPFD
jgi:hypothetical protein